MEGLLGTPLTLHRTPSTVDVAVDRTRRFLHRWVAMMFFSTLLIMLIGFLAANAFAG